jgi:spermidine synthase
VAHMTIARAESSRGELVLRRREWDGELELRVNGVFVMDSYETSTERALATLALDGVMGARGDASRAPLTVLVGGLGLGYTMAEFAASPLVGELIVSEIEPALVQWHRSGLIPLTQNLARSPRVRMVPRDVREVVASEPVGSLDVIVLDVDNGPGFLVYDDNAAIYQRGFLETCREALASKGILVVWSADRAPDLRAALDEVFGSVSHLAMPVTRNGRVDSYHAYVAPGHPGEDQTCPAP